MSQPDLLAELRESRPIAPAELREHVRRLAAQAPADPVVRRLPALRWRRLLVIAVPVAAAAAGAAIVLSGSRAPSRPAALEKTLAPTASAGASTDQLATSGAAASGAPAERTALPAPSPTRVQRITATLALRVSDAQAVSDATKQAAQIARSLGGFSSKLSVQTSGRSGYADLVLRIPKNHVGQAVSRLSALGTITGENVSIKDLQTQVDATTRKIERLQAKLTAWQQQPQTTETERHIASLSTALAKLRRGRTGTIRAASLATISLELSTTPAPAPLHHGHGPLHGLGVAFHWAWIGAVYAVALGGPVLLLVGLGWLAARALRRRREEALLSRS